MIYSYAELKGKVEVGDTVSAVLSKSNLCTELKSDGSNTQKITKVTEDYFWINGCSHYYSSGHFLNVQRAEITWNNIRTGDMVALDSRTYKILGTLDELVFISRYDDHKACFKWRTKTEMQSKGYTIVQPEQSEMVELTLEEVAKLKGVPVENLKIKE